ncbi:hypothetical protein MAA44156_00699 [Mycobacterium avium subsp. avium]|nr:hypothetical protein BBJ32_03880 [Mycobacterium avium]ETB13985.1 hypothetical protein P863_04285 [Mycobacterium avium subsp. silvaticum ATCC 49884]ETB16433.1 hypothetical protein O973_24280 [Mycobacterium avium subsp. avium 11-4751]ETB20560.1 hypothetical protein O972_03395 [Mycobacterium avium subsp. avium 10-9275]QGW30955.1 hypothetical protein MAA44156_00699 [Mycobacterium avium subsp. avium]
MTPNNDTLLEPLRYDFLVSKGDDKALIGLRIDTPDGGIIVPMTSQDAFAIGRGLVAHSDFLEQRPVRKWA